MNCAQCGYILFGLSEPRCPECGRGFEVTDYHFPPNAVHFLCPHCRQGYIGNDEHGLPRPRSFQCAKCRRHVTAGSLIVKPVRADAAGEALRFGNAWELRSRTGLSRAFVEAVRDIARRPAEFFGLSYANDRPGAVNFAITCGWLSAYLVLLTAALVLKLLGGLVSLPGESLLTFPVLMVVFAAVPVVVVLWVYFFAILVHLAFLCLGSPNADVEGSAQAIAYSCAVLPAMVLPIIGIPWYLYTLAIGLEHLHEISRGRALAATALAALFSAAAIAAAVTYGLMV